MKFKSLLAIGISLATLGLSPAAWAKPDFGGTIPSGPYPTCGVILEKCGGYDGGGRKHVPPAPSASALRIKQPDLPQQPPISTPTYPIPEPTNPQPHR